MIDIESTVFDAVSTKLKSKFNNISVYGEYVETPQSFPCVTLTEDDNYVARAFITNTKTENYVDVLYSAYIYSNLSVGKKAETKRICATIDEEMEKLGFTRTMKSQVPNIDRTIYRMVVKYAGRVKVFDVDGQTKFKVYGR